MFPYTVKYNESESHIQNNNLLYRIHLKYQSAFEHFDFSKFQKIAFKKKESNLYFVIYTALTGRFQHSRLFREVKVSIELDRSSRFGLIQVAQNWLKVSGPQHHGSTVALWNHSPKGSQKYKNPKIPKIYKSYKIWIMQFIHNSK